MCIIHFGAIPGVRYQAGQIQPVSAWLIILLYLIRGNFQVLNLLFRFFVLHSQYLQLLLLCLWVMEFSIVGMSWSRHHLLYPLPKDYLHNLVLLLYIRLVGAS